MLSPVLLIYSSLIPHPSSLRSSLLLEDADLSSERTSLITARPPGLVDVLDRILDKGLVIAGDIKVSLANVELLTLQIRLLVCSIDKAEQIGLNWWRYDTNLTTRAERA